METLTFQDTRSLLSTIQALYSLRDLNAFGVDALALVNQLVPSKVPTFSITNFHSHHIAHSFLPGHDAFTPEMEEVPRRHWHEHPFTQNMPLSLSTSVKISDFITQAELHQLEGLYQQFLRGMGCEDQMILFLPTIPPQNWHELLQRESSVVAFALNRTHQNFTERDRLILNLLRPHLFQAYTNAQHYQKLQNDFSQLQQSLNYLSLVILDTGGKVQFASPQALEWLETYFSRSSPSLQLPDLLWSWVKHQANCSAIKGSLPQVRLPLRVQLEGKQLVIRLVVEPFGERYLLLLEEQTLSMLKSLECLGLSQQETKVLAWVMQGKDNKAIAKHLSVCTSTVRKHLESIYRKLDVQSRTEAIAQALEKLGILNQPPLD